MRERLAAICPNEFFIGTAAADLSNAPVNGRDSWVNVPMVPLSTPPAAQHPFWCVVAGGLRSLFSR